MGGGSNLASLAPDWPDWNFQSGIMSFVAIWQHMPSHCNLAVYPVVGKH